MIKFYEGKDGSFETPSPLSEFFIEPRFSINDLLKKKQGQLTQQANQNAALGGCYNIFCMQACVGNNQNQGAVQNPIIPGKLTTLNRLPETDRILESRQNMPIPSFQEISKTITYMLVSMHISARNSKSIAILTLILIEKIVINSQNYSIGGFKLP